MNISELIKILEAELKTMGDVPVKFSDGFNQSDIVLRKNVRTIKRNQTRLLIESAVLHE